MAQLTVHADVAEEEPRDGVRKPVASDGVKMPKKVTVQLKLNNNLLADISGLLSTAVLVIGVNHSSHCPHTGADPVATTSSLILRLELQQSCHDR